MFQSVIFPIFRNFQTSTRSYIEHLLYSTRVKAREFRSRKIQTSTFSMRINGAARLPNFHVFPLYRKILNDRTEISRARRARGSAKFENPARLHSRHVVISWRSVSRRTKRVLRIARDPYFHAGSSLVLRLRDGKRA